MGKELFCIEVHRWRALPRVGSAKSVHHKDLGKDLAACYNGL
jgi:hypothetical protein